MALQLRLHLMPSLCLFLLCLRLFCSASPTFDSSYEGAALSLSDQDAHVDLPLERSRLDDRVAVSQRIFPRDESTAAASSTVAPSATSSSTSSPTLTAIPRPFDTSLGNNFTQTSCPMFFDSFLGNSTFQSCIPFSLLLQNSDAFFQVTASNATLNPILDDSCRAPFSTCSTLLWSLAGQLLSSSNCAKDYSLGNPLVVQAYRGLLSYAPMYKAACLKADSVGKATGSNYPYCYTSALNSSSGADSMLYFLPLGLGLPGGTSISCSSCTQQTMNIYSGAAIDSNSPLNKEYLPAANMINAACGANFVNASTAVVKTTATTAPNGAARPAPRSMLVASLLIVVGTAVMA